MSSAVRVSVQQKHKNENFESLMRRFKKAVDEANILREYQDRQYYEKPSAVNKRRKEAAKKRAERDRLAAQNVTPDRRGGMQKPK